MKLLIEHTFFQTVFFAKKKLSKNGLEQSFWPLVVEKKTTSKSSEMWGARGAYKNNEKCTEKEWEKSMIKNVVVEGVAHRNENLNVF